MRKLYRAITTSQFLTLFPSVSELTESLSPVAYLGGCIACACTPGGHKGAPKSDQKGRQKRKKKRRGKRGREKKKEKGRGKGKEKEKRKEKETKKRKGDIKWKERKIKMKKDDKWKEI